MWEEIVPVHFLLLGSVWISSEYNLYVLSTPLKLIWERFRDCLYSEIWSMPLLFSAGSCYSFGPCGNCFCLMAQGTFLSQLSVSISVFVPLPASPVGRTGSQSVTAQRPFQLPTASCTTFTWRLLEMQNPRSQESLICILTQSQVIYRPSRAWEPVSRVPGVIITEVSALTEWLDMNVYMLSRSVWLFVTLWTLAH